MNSGFETFSPLHLAAICNNLKNFKKHNLYAHRILKCIIFAVQTTKKIGIMSQSTMSIRVDSNLKRNFDALCDDFGLSNTAALIIFMKAVVRERKIPFEIKSESIEESRKKALLAFDKMREDVAAAGVQDLSIDEINEIIREVRDGEK